MKGIEATFSEFDVQGTGTVTKRHFAKVFKDLDLQLTKGELDKVWLRFDKDNSGVVTVAKVVRKEEGGDFNSNHTVLLYFFFIMLLVFVFSFYSSLLFLFDTFLYYFIMYLITNT